MFARWVDVELVDVGGNLNRRMEVRMLSMPGRDTGIRSQGRAQMSDRQCGMPTGEARRAACRPASLRGAIHIGFLCLAGAVLATESAIAVQVKDVWGRPLGDFDLRPGVDLHGVNLRYANLQEIDLTGADLSHADLRYADLTGAILRESLFHKVLLRGAKLDDADFSDARMDWATLSHASLKGTMLRSTTMDYADLRYADLEEADLKTTDRQILFERKKGLRNNMLVRVSELL